MAYNTRHSLGYFSVYEVERKLGLRQNALRSKINRSTIPAPTHLVGKRYYYVEADLPQIRLALEAHTAAPNTEAGRAAVEWVRAKARAAGLCNVARAAQALTMPAPTLWRWIEQGKVPQPGYKVKGCNERHYSEADLWTIRKTRPDYFVRRIKLL